MAVKYVIQRYWPPPPQEKKIVIVRKEVEVDRIQSDDEKKINACSILKTFPDKVFDGITNGEVLKKLIASLDRCCRDCGTEASGVSS